MLVDLVVAPMQHLVGVGQRGLAMRAGHRLGRHRFVGITGQRTATAFTTKAALARSGALDLVWLVRLLPPQWRQAGIVRGFRRLGELGFEHRDASRQALHLRSKRLDQSIFLGVAQVLEVRKSRHAGS